MAVVQPAREVLQPGAQRQALALARVPEPVLPEQVAVALGSPQVGWLALAWPIALFLEPLFWPLPQPLPPPQL